MCLIWWQSHMSRQTRWACHSRNSCLNALSIGEIAPTRPCSSKRTAPATGVASHSVVTCVSAHGHNVHCRTSRSHDAQVRQLLRPASHTVHRRGRLRGAAGAVAGHARHRAQHQRAGAARPGDLHGHRAADDDRRAPTRLPALAAALHDPVRRGDAARVRGVRGRRAHLLAADVPTGVSRSVSAHALRVRAAGHQLQSLQHVQRQQHQVHARRVRRLRQWRYQL